MRPAGMSSDEDFDDDDCYFSDNLPAVRSNRNRVSAEEALPEKIDGGLKHLLDSASRISAFHRAAEEGNFELMRELITMGVNVDESRLNEWTPLMKVCSRGSHEVAEFLLQNGANPNAHKELFTPLMACCISSYTPEEGRLSCARLLIQAGANVNATDKFKSTALIIAVTSGLETVVDELLTVPNININLKDKEGWNALFYAVNKNHKSIVVKLINAGIDVNAVSEYGGYTALQLAQIKEHSEIVKILKVDDDEEILPDEAFQIRDPLDEFFKELPDENGQGGFSSEVRNIFLGLGYEKMYDDLRIKIGLADFLVMIDELDKLGIHLEPLRRKIIIEGIHRYHVFPWKKTSLHHFQHPSVVRFEDCINSIANITKHLTVFYATLNYIKIRLPKRIKEEGSLNKDIITVLVDCYGEIKQLETALTVVLELADNIKPVGKFEADFVGGKTGSDRKKYKYLWIFLAGTITAAGTIFYYKLK